MVKIYLTNPCGGILSWVVRVSRGMMEIMKHGTKSIKGPEAFMRFDTLVGAVLSVPHSVIVHREQEYRKRSEENPNRRGPKRKVKPPASSGHAEADDR